MLRPDSRFRRSWDYLIALLMLLAMVEIPLRLALDYDPRAEGLVLVFEILMTACFSADIILNFFTAVRDRNGLITERSGVARRYLRSGFVLDLLAALPLFLLVNAPGWGGLRILEGARPLYLNRLFKLKRMIGVFHAWKMRHRLSPGTYRLVFFVLGISMFAHWAACGWIGLSGNRSYVDAIYWTVTTLTTVGYGDIVPATEPMKLYTMMVMIAGAGSYGYIIGNFASMLANLDLVRAEQHRKMDQVSAFMRHHSIPADIHLRVREYYEHLFSSHSAAAQDAILAELPVLLKTEIALHMHRDILAKVPLFHDADEEFLRAVVLRLRAVVRPPGASIVTEGQAGEEMYFIDSGTVEVLDRDGRIRSTLAEGDYFGEMALVLDTHRTATVRCQGFCEFYVLSKQDFEEVLPMFPEFADHVRRTVRERLGDGGDQREPTEPAGADETGKGR